MSAAELELLYEEPGLPGLGLPDELQRRYGGDIGFDGPRVVTNFVATIDGVVAIPSVAGSNKLIAADSDADRFVMALLRACADVVLIGSGTLQGSPRGRWTPEGAFPDAATALEELRRRLGKPPLPELAIVTGSGMVDPAHPAFERGAVVLTTDGGAQALEGRLPDASHVVSLGPGPLVDLARAVDHLRTEGHELVLAEAGPHVLGSLLAERLVDELFLTISPLLAGRAEGETRFGLVEGEALLPDVSQAARLLGVRRSGRHLFLRYELRAAS
ncbi:MAG TPA: dihydrofolate reductase family protein [Gaiellaceae bacterium]|nr:dihydrofolate reductase family protein [Gaiellaceae bacterium]